MGVTRRNFISGSCLGAAALGIMGLDGRSEGRKTLKKTNSGVADTTTGISNSNEWTRTSERRIRVGIAGYGESRFGAAFSFQNHPHVEVAAVSDLLPARCANLARECRCTRTYPSLEKMIRDDSIEAVFLATDAPSHARHAIEVLNHGKHVAVAVPALFGSLDLADELLSAVKRSGLNYMMFETSAFHDDLYAMRTLFEAGISGELVYSEGEYYHYMPAPIPSYKNWRVGLPPMWYPTHATA